MFGTTHHELLKQCRSNLFGYAYALTRDADQAADLFQDCVVRAMSNAAPPHGASAFRGWLFTIMRNLWIDQLRARKRRGEVQEDLEPAGDAPAQLPDTVTVNRMAVRQAFARLSKDHRDVLALVDIGGFGYQETARMLGVPKGTVMSRVSRARLALARLLADSRVEPFPVERRRLGHG